MKNNGFQCYESVCSKWPVDFIMRSTCYYVTETFSDLIEDENIDAKAV